MDSDLVQVHITMRLRKGERIVTHHTTTFLSKEVYEQFREKGILKEVGENYTNFMLICRSLYRLSGCDEFIELTVQ